MILFVLTDNAPFVMLVLLVALVYLTWIELRPLSVPANVKLWWCSLVLLFNVPAYLALRVWVVVRRRREAGAR
jgi:hypothetical protein